MRWLLVKDLQILRRSPLLVGLLVLYSVMIAVLLGYALGADPGKPRVAFVNLVPAGESDFSIGGESLDVSEYSDDLFEAIEPVRVKTRAEAIEKVRSGETLGALVLPADATEKLQSSINLTGGDPPEVEVYYNAENPLKLERVRSTIEAQLGEANRALSRRLTEIAVQYLDIIVTGGNIKLFGQTLTILGLEKSNTILRAQIEALPEDDPARAALQQVSRFAGLAADNLNISEPILQSLGEPVRVKETVVDGEPSGLAPYLVAVAVTLSLMFVALLLAAGALALEREEHAYTRLVRGLVSRWLLVVEKTILAALLAFAVGLATLAGLAAFEGLDWGRVPLWLVALAAGAVAFGAMGVAIGSVTREVRAASLLAFILCLPVAALALVPSGAVAPGVYDAIQAVNAVFPFKATLQALDAAVNAADPALPQPLLHLAALALGFGVLARLALRRFA
jgi:ABC-2 type transport system permease protein